MQVNVFAQAHLILTLLPVLRKTEDSRIVSQSSDLHRAAPSSVKFQSLQEINTDIGATYLYNRTKLAQILFSRELIKRIKAGQFGTVSETEELRYHGSTPRIREPLRQISNFRPRTHMAP